LEEILKIGIIADIHSNIVAFDAILEDLNKHNDIKVIVIAGDFLGDGSNPVEVIERILKIKPYLIKGNRENDILDYYNGKKSEFNELKQFSSMKWTCEKIGKKYLKYIKDLPEQCVIDIKNTDKIRVVHGSPRHIYEHLYPDKLLDRLDNSTKLIEEKYLICGHTHKHWHKTYNNKVIINPGSAGISFNDFNSTEYSILEWKNEIWEQKHIYLKYDKNKVIENFNKSGLLKSGGFWAELTMESILKNKNYMVGFIKFVKDEINKRGYKVTGNFSNELWDLGIEIWKSSKEKFDYKY
jgi:putative phosphoesterase